MRVLPALRCTSGRPPPRRSGRAHPARARSSTKAPRARSFSCFFHRDVLARRTVLQICAQLHLDEQQHAVLLGDEVDLAEAAAPLVPRCGSRARSDTFSTSASPQSPSCFVLIAAPPTFEERHAVHGARAVLIEHLVVELCAVALVPGELILGIHRVEHFDHIMVTADLRQHARRGDG